MRQWEYLEFVFGLKLICTVHDACAMIHMESFFDLFPFTVHFPNPSAHINPTYPLVSEIIVRHRDELKPPCMHYLFETNVHSA